jgi:hypothetical protein
MRPSAPFSGCKVPSTGPLHEYETDLPAASTTWTRHALASGVPLMMFKVIDFGGDGSRHECALLNNVRVWHLWAVLLRSGTYPASY